jgi:hypothetical protein
VRAIPGRVWGGGLDSRRAARAVVAIEMLTGVALLLVGTAYFSPASYLALVLFLCFVVISARAYRMRIPCGCFAANKAITERGDIARTAILVAMAGVVVAGNLGGSQAIFTAPSLLVAVGAAVVAWAPVLLTRTVRLARLRNAQTANLATASGETRTLSLAVARTRRSFIVETITLAAAVMGITALAPSSALPADSVPSCIGLYKTCLECCNPYESCADCCDGCYQSCINHTYKCHGGTCINLTKGEVCWEG